MSDSSENPFRSKLAVARFALVAMIGVAIDLGTKVWAFAKLEQRIDEYHFIPGWLHFKTIENRGAVFGIGEGQRGLFLAVSCLAIVFLVYLFKVSKPRQWFYHVLLGMLLAGVIGNMYDRFMYGHVRDMIYALPGWEWPGTWNVPMLKYPDEPGPNRAVFPWIFNVADTLLCVGVALMLAHSFFSPHDRKLAKEEPAAE